MKLLASVVNGRKPDPCSLLDITLPNLWFLVEAEVVQEVGLSNISAEAVVLRPVVWEVLELFRREKVPQEFQQGWFSWQVEYP